MMQYNYWRECKFVNLYGDCSGVYTKYEHTHILQTTGSTRKNAHPQSNHICELKLMWEKFYNNVICNDSSQKPPNTHQ